jgi:N-acetylmuramic acid 6-phosphate (MurNAc-6-P) etherase
VGSSKIAKRIDKLEAEADKLRKRAEKKGKQLSDQVVEKVEDLTAEEDKGGKKGLFLLLLGMGAAAAAFVLKRKRDQELDEALWEEPRSL